ncbi:RNA polymerase sigma factor [Mycolicibacterium phlei]
MTAVPEWHVEDVRTTDAELVHASVSGDREAFAAIYDRYADRLHDFCVGMLRDLDAAADCVQETFCIAATRLHQLRDPDKLRPWLYSVARNEALRRLRELSREAPTEELPESASDDAAPDTLSARTELADLVAEAAGGLSERDQAVLDLTFRHGLDGPDLAEALGVSRASANTLLSRLRKTVERSLGALLVSRRAQKGASACPDLRGLLAAWDGEFTVLMRKRISRHVESCSVCDEERRRLVSPTALLGAAPVLVPAPKWLRDKTMQEVQLVSHNTALADGSGLSGDGRDERRRMLLAAVFIAELAAATALLLAYISSPTSVAPVDATETAPSAVPGAPQAPPQIRVPPMTLKEAPPEVTPPVVAPPTPRFAPTSQVPPLPIAPPPPSRPAEAPPPAAEPSVRQTAPSTKPPMSFRPSAVTPDPPPETGDGNKNDGGGRSPDGRGRSGPTPG